MRCVLGLVAITFLWSPQGSTHALSAPSGIESPSERLVQGNTEFAFALYKQIAREEGNVVVSPLSVSVATAMLYAGARGQTERQIASTARFELPQETLHAEFAGLLDELGKRVEPWAKLYLADGLWVDGRCRALPEYIELLSRCYDAVPQSVDFRGRPSDVSSRINDFISERTHGKIPSMVSPDMFSDKTRLVLANTVYFLAAWKYFFRDEDTRQEPFHPADSSTVSVDMMHGTRSVRYCEDGSVQVLELPYQGSGLSMLLVLPAAGVGLAGLEAEFTPDLLSRWVDSLASREVEMAVPRFEVTRRIDLVPVLASMGMTDVFHENSSDLRGVCGEGSLFVERAIHEATLGITETGTEATAATVYLETMGGEAVPLEPPVVVSFRADRPFIYIVRDMRNGTILFMGRFVNP